MARKRSIEKEPRKAVLGLAGAADGLKDGDGNLLEAPTEDTGFVLANEETAVFTPYPIELGTEFSDRHTQQTVPGGAVVYYSSGRRGATVTVSLRRVANSGGHAHGGETAEPAAVGSVAPAQFVLGQNYPQNVRILHRVTDVCGDIFVLANYSTGSHFECITEVRIPGLVPITASPSLHLKAPTPGHPSPYHVAPDVLTKLLNLANAYSAKTHKPVTITDASLAMGGRFDLNQNWQPPHHEHMQGRSVDVRSNDMTPDDQKVFREEAARAAFQVLQESNHWHLRA